MRAGSRNLKPVCRVFVGAIDLMASENEMNDEIVIPGYVIHSLIGRGGMAEVYLATQESLSRKVAIKVLQDKHDKAFNERFINEGKFIASISNPHLISVYDIARLADGRHYIAMEFVIGGDLTKYAGEIFPPEYALMLIRQLAQALVLVHKKGVVHRDIKPANILFRDDQTVLLTDFGIAKDLQTDVTLTQAGTALGSAAYSSPEQSQGLPVNFQTDMYSLGVVLLEMLIGYNPYQGKGYTDTIINHVQMETPPLPEHLAYYQPLLDKLLAKLPEDRFTSAAALVDEITLYINKEAPTPAEDVVQKTSSRRSVQVISVAAASVVLVVAGVFVWHSTSTESPTNNSRDLVQTVVPEQIAPSPDIASAASVDEPDTIDEASDMSVEDTVDETSQQVLNSITDEPVDNADDTSDLPTPAVNENDAEEIAAVSSPEPLSAPKLSPIERTLADAEQQFARGNLVGAGNKTALALYNSVLAKDAGNKVAAEGVQRVVQELLVLATKRLSRDRLTLPKNDNAVHYFQEVLQIDANNQQAKKGLQDVVARYTALAKSAGAKGNKNKSLALIARGLELDPDNKQLAQMQAEAQQAMQKAQSSKSVDPEQPDEAEKPVEHPVGKFFKRLFE
jgi:serine/threonine protein kinase